MKTLLIILLFATGSNCLAGNVGLQYAKRDTASTQSAKKTPTDSQSNLQSNSQANSQANLQSRSEPNPKVSSKADGRANHWTLLSKYSQVTHIHSSYRNTNGQRYRDSQNVDYRFVGLGVAYQYNLSESWSVFPEITFSKNLNNSSKNLNDLSLLIGSLNLGRTVGNGQLFGGISTQKLFPTSGLKYTPSLGIRVGYELYLGGHSSLNFGFEFLTFKSENTGDGISDQSTEMRSFMIGYGYRI